MEVVGPNMAEVARRLREPKEKVSYTFRSNIDRKGYRVQARPDRGALGLREAAALVDLDPEYAPLAGYLFDRMDRSFINGFNRTLPDGKFFLLFTLPEQRYDEFPKLLGRMKEAGLITEVHRTLRFSGRRHRPMRAELFDFKRSRWEFEWSQPPPGGAPEFPARTPRQKLDPVDVSILGYLFVNAESPVREIAKEIGVTPKTAYRHAQHIAEGHMIQSYGVNWMKTQMYDDLSRPFAPQHKFAFMHVDVLGVNPKEVAWLREKLNALPYLWVEYLGPDYAAEIPVPLEQVVETMSYLREVLEPVAERSICFMVDTASSRAYSPPAKAFDVSKGDWGFDLDDQTSYLKEQMDAVRKQHRAGGKEAQSDAKPG